MWRWWTPLLVGFDDPKITAAQAKLSHALFEQPHTAKGYTSYMADVEHTGEDTADTITPMLFLAPESVEWPQRARRIADLASSLWMGVNERGFLQFRSTWFTADNIDLEPKRACDTVYHPRALQPSMLLWQRTGDAQIGSIVTRWMDTWVDAAARAEHGKPAGVVPSAIHWPDGEVGGGVEPWWQPQNYSELGLYAWPSAMSSLVQTLLLTYHMTGDEKYLQPLRSMADIRRSYLAEPPTQTPPEGSEAWCAARMASFLSGVLSKYRLLTGNPEFDDLLKADARGYTQMRLGLGMETLVSQLEANARAFRINKAAYTSEVRWTDRVLNFNERWGRLGNQWDWASPLPSVLYSSATGDPGDALHFPMNAVRWLTNSRKIAALVTESATDRFAAELYHFGDEPRPMEAELYLLKPGTYRVELLSDGKMILPESTLSVNGPRAKIALELPSRRLCTLRISAAKP